MREIFLFMIGVIGFQNVHSCDNCAGTMSAQIGLLGDIDKNSFGLLYRLSNFEISSNYGKTYDVFQHIEAFGNYYIDDKWQAGFNLPFKFNQRENEDGMRSMLGFSDISLHLGYLWSKRLPNEKFFGSNSRFTLKLPTGNYISDIHDQDLPQSFNIGNGSWGYSLSNNTLISYKKWTSILSLSISKFSKSSSGYLFGSQGQFLLMQQYSLQLNRSVILLPRTGISYSYISQDRYKNGNADQETGQEIMNALFEINMNHKNLIFSNSFSLPLVDSFKQEGYSSTIQFKSQIIYQF